MAKVHVCPGNLSAKNEASKKLGCGYDEYGNNQYLCLPNVNKTSLVEFCHDGIMRMQEKGMIFLNNSMLLVFIICPHTFTMDAHYVISQ